MEHIIASKLTQHFNKHNILYDLQHGFRERRSCKTQLIQLVEDLGRKLIEHKQVDLVLLDFSKAFDKVSHSKLLFILSQHGVKGNTLNWIRAFLVGRTQAVVLEGESSSEVSVTSGQNQNSLLVKRQTDNTTPGGGMGLDRRGLVPSSHKRSKFRHTII